MGCELKIIQEHGDLLHASRVMTPQTSRKRQETLDIHTFLPVSCNCQVKKLLMDVSDHHDF